MHTWNINHKEHYLWISNFLFYDMTYYYIRCITVCLKNKHKSFLDQRLGILPNSYFFHCHFLHWNLFGEGPVMSYKVSAPSAMIPQPIWPPCSTVTQIIKNICLAFLSTFFSSYCWRCKKPCELSLKKWKLAAQTRWFWISLATSCWQLSVQLC